MFSFSHKLALVNCMDCSFSVQGLFCHYTQYTLKPFVILYAQDCSQVGNHITLHLSQYTCSVVVLVYANCILCCFSSFIICSIMIANNNTATFSFKLAIFVTDSTVQAKSVEGLPDIKLCGQLFVNVPCGSNTCAEQVKSTEQKVDQVISSLANWQSVRSSDFEVEYHTNFYINTL